MTNQTLLYFKNFVYKIDDLSQKEKDILSKRLEGKTLSSIGKKEKLTAERIRQIELKIIQKIKCGIRQKKLF